MPRILRRLLGVVAVTLLLGGAGLMPPHPHSVTAALPISRMQLSWWRERHEQKLAEAKHGPWDLVFLGDSITQDYEYAGPQPFHNFRPVWQHFYGDRRALNLGFGGDATSHLLWRMQNGELDGLAPKAAVILIGANNLGRLHWPTADDVAGIDAVVAEARKRLPHTHILLLGVLPSERSAWVTQTTQEINHALALKYHPGAVPNVTFMNIDSIFMRDGKLDTSLFLDQLLQPPDPPLHPTPQGQALMAAAIEPTLAAMLGDRDHTKPAR